MKLKYKLWSLILLPIFIGMGSAYIHIIKCAPLTGKGAGIDYGFCLIIYWIFTVCFIIPITVWIFYYICPYLRKRFNKLIFLMAYLIFLLFLFILPEIILFNIWLPQRKQNEIIIKQNQEKNVYYNKK